MRLTVEAIKALRVETKKHYKGEVVLAERFDEILGQLRNLEIPKDYKYLRIPLPVGMTVKLTKKIMDKPELVPGVTLKRLENDMWDSDDIVEV